MTYKCENLCHSNSSSLKCLVRSTSKFNDRKIEQTKQVQLICEKENKQSGIQTNLHWNQKPEQHKGSKATKDSSKLHVQLAYSSPYLVSIAWYILHTSPWMNPKKYNEKQNLCCESCYFHYGYFQKKKKKSSWDNQ